MARKKDERLVKQAYKEERKAKAAQKKVAESCGAAGEPYLQPNDDHFVSFKKQLATMGLMLRDIPGDGNCLFRALNDQMEGHSRNHLRLRHDTVRFMIEHRVDFEPFVEDDVPFQTHVRQLSQPGTYGGHDALVAFARMQKINIVIHQLNSPLWQIEGGPNGCTQLHLSYHNGEHYSSVRRVGDTSESAANIRINMTPDAVAGTSVNNGNKKNQEQRFPWQDHVYGCDEVIVQTISDRTGCKDLQLISEALADYDGDEHAATDYVTSVMVATEAPPVRIVEELDQQQQQSVVAASSASGQAVKQQEDQAENYTGSGANGGKAKATPAKKLTNKKRKEQNRREKATTKPNRSVADGDRKSGAEDPDDAIVVEAAFGCLRI